MKKDDEILSQMFKALDTDIIVTEETKQRILEAVYYGPNKAKQYYLLCYHWVFAKFMKISIPISVILIFMMQVEAH